MVVAVGGGSVIDIAKAVCAMKGHAEDATGMVMGEISLEPPVLPLVAIPTTAGSGSEATHFAVVYVGQQKYSLAQSHLLPEYALVDPELTHSMSPALTAVTGFDALGQAIESYWATGATSASRVHAARAIRTIMPAIREAVHRPTPEVRTQMAYGAFSAGVAINMSKTTAPHALSYPLTMRWGIPHGHAVALTLGNFFVINARPTQVLRPGSGGQSRFAQSMMELCQLVGGSDPGECSQILYTLMEDLGMETDLNSLGALVSDEIDWIVTEVNQERLGNNPVELTPDMLKEALLGRLSV
jgi:alcohol dehydrogenase class IV